MCVIAYQTKDQDYLTYSEFCNMADRNPHGMGYMALIGGTVVYNKGYFNVDDFYKDYLKARKMANFKEIAIHFRIGTGSDINKAMCHPFPLTNDSNMIKATKGIADVCVMMNGIIGESTKEFSDTAIYVMNNLYDYYMYDKRFFMNFSQRQLMLFENEIHGNRFVLMSKDGSRLFGSGWTDYEGKCEVSNRYWIPITQRYTANSKGYKSYIDYWEAQIMD